MRPPNRRRHSRVRVRNTVAHSGLERRRQIWVVDNISAGGLFVRTENVLPLGATVELDVVRPGLGGPLQLQGRVVLVVDPATAQARSAPPGMGIAFEALAEPIRARLDEMLGTLGAPLNVAVTDLRSAPDPLPSRQSRRTSAEPPLSAIRRRQHRRVDARRLLAHLRIDDEVVELGLAVDNLSLGGCFLVCSAPKAAGTEVKLEMVHPSLSRALLLSGVVVSSVPLSRATAQGLRAGVAVRFGTMTRTSLGRLRELLGTLVPPAAGEFQQAPAATEISPDDPDVLGPGYSAEIARAREVLFGHNAVDLSDPADSPEATREQLEGALARLREEVRVRQEQIAALEGRLDKRH
jgi:uncharacterized protein (TIGR02266 family)